MKRIVKRIAERALVMSGFPLLGRTWRRHDTLILAYHNVLSPGDLPAGDTSLHLPVDLFVQQLDLVARTCDVVPLPTIFDEERGRKRPRVVITFDDAYLGALTTAVPELARRGMVATMFVAPGLLGQRPWWDVLAEPAVGALRPAVRQRALDEFAGRTVAVLAGMRPSTRTSADTPRIATETELALGARSPSLTLASHSWSHANLTVLGAMELERELREPLTWLRERFPSVIPWLSYPYGLVSPEVQRATAASGYTGALRVEGGWIGKAKRGSRHALPRYNVPAGLSLDGFRLRLAGLA